MADTGERGAANNPRHPDRSKAMYLLTLTTEERRAFDWVGDRYNSGKVADLLTKCIPEDREWGNDGDIPFEIPEHIAWEIDQLAEEEGYTWACSAPDLAGKLNEFC